MIPLAILVQLRDLDNIIDSMYNKSVDELNENLKTIGKWEENPISKEFIQKRVQRIQTYLQTLTSVKNPKKIDTESLRRNIDKLTNVKKGSKSRSSFYFQAKGDIVVETELLNRGLKQLQTVTCTKRAVLKEIKTIQPYLEKKEVIERAFLFNMDGMSLAMFKKWVARLEPEDGKWLFSDDENGQFEKKIIAGFERMFPGVEWRGWEMDEL
jgi:hypothetical protein